jgi:hypothetical protein
MNGVVPNAATSVESYLMSFWQRNGLDKIVTGEAITRQGIGSLMRI